MLDLVSVETKETSFKKKRYKGKISTYLYLLPALVLIIGLFVYSVIFTFVTSFSTWDGLGSPTWTGFKNYIQFFHDPVVTVSLINTIVWVVVSLIVPVGLGLFLSVVLQNIWGKTLFKTVFYLPYAISLTTTGIIWSYLFSPPGLNTLFQTLHLSSWQHQWLTQPPYNTISMIIASIWQGMGTYMALFLVGLQSLPKEPFEAAMIDGASRIRTFFSITFPLLRPFTIVVFGIALVNSFKVFDIIWVMTQGGPYRSSETLAVTMYRESFVSNHYGVGASIAMILTVLTFICSGFYLWRTIQKGDH